MVSAVSAGLLVLSGCSSDTSGSGRTVTAVVTVSSGADASGSADPAASGSAAPSDAASGSVDPSAASSSGVASSAPAGSSAATPTGPIVTVDPLKADCGSLLNAADVKRITGVDIPNDRLKVNVAEVNADIGQVGRVRCLYGLSEDKKSGQITLALTTYKDVASAQRQVQVTVEDESNQGGTVTPVTVAGYPASVAVRDGGLLVMDYDTWTLAIAAPATGFDQATLTTTMPQLAEAVLSRLLKS